MQKKKAGATRLTFDTGVLRAGSIEQIVPHQLLQQLITIELADETSGVVIIRDIGRILRKKIANNLVDGIITLFAKGIIY